MHPFPAVILSRMRMGHHVGLIKHGSGPSQPSSQCLWRKTRVMWGTLFLAHGNTQQWGLREPGYPKSAHSVGNILNILIVELTNDLCVPEENMGLS